MEERMKMNEEEKEREEEKKKNALEEIRINKEKVEER
jgi:hypothetical protein